MRKKGFILLMCTSGSAFYANAKTTPGVTDSLYLTGREVMSP